MQRALSPDAAGASAWMWLEWFDVLKKDKNGCIWVKRGWKKMRREKVESEARVYRDLGFEPPQHRFATWEDALRLLAPGEQMSVI